MDKAANFAILTLTIVSKGKQSICDNIPIQKIELHFGFLEDALGLLGRVILVHGDDAPDAAVDDHLRAGVAGRHAAVEGGCFQRNAELRGLANCILLRVSRADAVIGGGAVLVEHLLHLVAGLIAVRKPDRGADIAGDENLVVADDDATGLAAVAGGPRADLEHDLREILVPARALVLPHGKTKFARIYKSILATRYKCRL